ncbi:hypothetical protein PG993_003599 [Apiospora rasikravindrae]|uniref:Uncharacterized protein n=1 Tax=Apiospora rasikravindrae TaxID=990691 RepID=A0ABR1TZZ1_9PEZI
MAPRTGSTTKASTNELPLLPKLLPKDAEIVSQVEADTRPCHLVTTEEAPVVSERIPEYMCILCDHHTVVGRRTICDVCRTAAQNRLQQKESNAQRVDEVWAQTYGKDRNDGREEPARCALCRITPAMDGKPRCYNCTMIGNAQAAKESRWSRERRVPRKVDLAQMRHRELLEQGRCSRCASEWPADGQKECTGCLRADEAKREETLERSRGRFKARYEARKAQGLCANCGKARAQSGRTQCAGCAEGARKRGMDREAWERRLELRRNQREKIKSKGLCIICRRRPHRAERTSCEECALERKVKKVVQPPAHQDRDLSDTHEPVQDNHDIDEGDLHVPSEEVQEGNGQGVMETVSRGDDRMAIDFILC